ncbi:hypothetical protein Zmor_014909 [Zophobas morio]|uniref:Uncharacterized protein n=1 Tax=Zophobas morio TaxID=2755281 RepID=A0AA38IKH4_9CUCU|nr:hypothetical protein Zmor_014909 [Zophobas morio]
MVKLRRLNMSILKDVVIETEEGVIAEAWIALLQTGICINSRYAFLDGFYYKDDVLLRDTGIVSQFRIYCGHKIMTLTFGSGTDKEQFRRFIQNTDGIGDPPPSLAVLSISPSPPAPPPSLASSSSSPSPPLKNTGSKLSSGTDQDH